MADRYTLAAVDINTVGVGATYDVSITQVQRATLNPGIMLWTESGDGVVYPTFTAVSRQEPVISFDTTKVATVLGTIGFTGLAITADVDELGARFYLQRIAEGGTRTGAGANFLMTMREGLIVPTSFTADADGTTMGLEAHATYDGSNEPLTFSTGQSLAAAGGTTEKFVVGPAYINGVQLTEVQSISIEPGIEVRKEGGDGTVWPTFVYIARIAPVITIVTQDALALNTFGLDGTAQGVTDSYVYFKKVAEGGTRVANATAEHISFTVDEGIITIDTTEAPNDGVATTTVRITTTYDGSNVPIVVSTTAAIA